jgi:hypothetical protein
VIPLRRTAFLLATALAGLPVPALAQDWLLLDGIADGEFWATDSGSPLLTRNDGTPAPLGRVQLFFGAAIRPELQLLALGELEAGKGGAEGKTEVDYDQLLLRYLRSPALVIDVGKFASPVGTFANRRFSPVNPLIGVPEGYPVTYPWGVKVDGTAGQFDYRAALISLPVSNENFVPEPAPWPRPALGAGFTPITGLRIGASYTRGPYLNADLGTAIPSGTFWENYAEQVVAFDGSFSRGYFEFHGEAAVSHYQIPTRESITGFGAYLEFKYTLAPRFFLATRLEYNKYAYIEPESDAPWEAELVPIYNGEFGAGYRLGAKTLLKLSYRRDTGSVEASQKSEFPSGNALAFQVSQSFDLKGLFTGHP